MRSINNFLAEAKFMFGEQVAAGPAVWVNNRLDQKVPKIDSG